MAASERHKASKKKKTKDRRLKRGSRKYLHLLNFIATRREKKLEKRKTLDPSAKVKNTMLYPASAADDDDYDDMMMLWWRRCLKR